MNVKETLLAIQTELKAPKSQYNSFGKYNYRSCEDIVEAVKPLLSKHGASLMLSDAIVQVGDRVYVKASAIFSCKEDDVELISSAFAREPGEQKGQSESQVTGTASSYARKYALNGLFLIDDSKDADTDEYRGGQGGTQSQQAPQAPAHSAADIAEMKKWTDGTFTKEELDDIKKNLKGPRYKEVFENAKKEYMERKLKQEQSQMAEEIY